MEESETFQQTLNKFLDHFQCAICISTLKTTYTTKNCAHRYCEVCIKECINTLHKCPLCNRVLNSEDDIVKDAQYDDLISAISKLRDKDDENFLKKLISKDDNNNIENQNDENLQFNPLENVLKKHLMGLLNTHRSYYNQLKNDYLNEIKLIDENTNKKLVIEYDNEKRKIIQDKAQEAKDLLKEKFEETTNVVCKLYDKYLTDNIPKPSVIQAKIRVRVLRKNLKFDSLLMQPTDDISVVFKYVENKVKEIMEDKIVGYDDNVDCLCFGPFTNYTSQEIERIYENYKNKNELDDFIHVIKKKNCMPVLEYSIKPGSEIVICGYVKFESDLPLKCFIKKFDPNNIKPVDYYTCKTCGFNWICKNCCITCHKDHDVSPYSIGHKPSWACCYCKKTKSKCTIIDN